MNFTGAIPATQPPIIGAPVTPTDLCNKVEYRESLKKRRRISPDSVPDAIFAQEVIQEHQVVCCSILINLNDNLYFS
jgi:hypothetical protein